MKKLDSSIVAALIVSTGIIVAVLIYVYNTPYEQCKRAYSSGFSDKTALRQLCHNLSNWD